MMLARGLRRESRSAGDPVANAPSLMPCTAHPSLIADAAEVAGLVCLGYPFHPPRRPQRARPAHLEDLRTPTLILQGVPDPFGSRTDVAGYPLSQTIAAIAAFAVRLSG